MPVINCQCGRKTNTAVARWVGSALQDPNPIPDSLTVLALECYVAWDDTNQRWVPGCAKDIPAWTRRTVESLLRDKSAT